MNFFYENLFRKKIRGVVIDAGHGGDDPGAISGDVFEKDLTLRAAQYMYKRLNELGIPATIVRSSDETLGRKERIKRIMDAYGNSPDIILISNHINAGGGEGAEAVYALRNNNTLSELILNNMEKAGQIKRKSYQKRLPEDPSKDYYFIIRDTKNLESILLEYGFIDNKNDQNKLINNIEQYVEAAVKAIAEYAGVEYIPNKYYIVKENDNLYDLAIKFNTTINDIKKLNNLSSDLLQIGQKLLIPNELDNNFIKYIVKNNDTLYKISLKYNVSINDIKKLNNLTDNTLYIGQELMIPKVNSNNNDIVYIVKKGDSLWKISQIYKVSIPNLLEVNKLNTNILSIGQELIIPQGNNIEHYIVKKGDTLWTIARETNTSIETIKELNNLKSNFIKVGDKLIIK